MKLLAILFGLVSTCFAQATIPCIGGPGNTPLSYNQQCISPTAQITYVCPLSVGCTLSSQLAKPSPINFSTQVKNRTADQMTYTTPDVFAVPQTIQNVL